ncbi:hypothetical protein H5410_021167 [Solanum commersonii]|uniref:Uncharacterized protein n=1 Tax=Solanum commersonii TaxID=4109 RepID=A0A9J5ZGD2_SOLCO|nr:hypothetical protein H5410_021167 [Solanum commersonii]
MTLIGKNRSTTTISSRNNLAKTSIPIPHNFYPMKDDDTLFLEAEVTRDAQRSDNLQKSAFEIDKSKKVIGVLRFAQKSDASPFESGKAKEVFEVAQGAKETETSIIIALSVIQIIVLFIDYYFLVILCCALFL